MLYKIADLVKVRQREKGYKLHIRRLEIPLGAMLALTGESGCGKSTTLDILGLSLRPDAAGAFLFRPEKESVDIMELWQRGEQDKLAALRLGCMGYVLQSGELLPFLSTGENMMLTARLRGMERGEAEDYARALARELGIEELWDSMPATLSVGERQRAAICRALAQKPEIILADEPTAALDPLHAADVMNVFLDAVKKTGCTLLLVTHNVEWAKRGGLAEARFRVEKDVGGGTRVTLDYAPGEKS